MNTIKTALILSALAATFSSCGQSNKQNNQNVMHKRLDFNLLEEKAVKERIVGENYYAYTLEYENADSSWCKLSGNKVDGFVEWTTPKLPLFYKVYSEYYANGTLKLTGYCIGSTACKFSIWNYFDKNGNQTKEVDEDAKYGAYDYSKVLLFLHFMGHINLETGEGREGLVLVYDKKEKIWQASVTDKFYKITEYEIDGETGDIISDKTYQGGNE